MSTMTMKTIGILETGLAPDHLVEEHGSYIDMMTHLVNSASETPAFNFRGYSIVNNEFPDSVQDCDGWLITGSKHGVYDDLPWIAPLKELVREIYQADIPLIGICFGHQIMVEALGGKVIKSDKGWGLGLNTYQLDETPDWMHADNGSLTLNAIHQDQVVELPDDAAVFASSDFCSYAGLVYGTNSHESSLSPRSMKGANFHGKAFSLQPHPEFSIAYEQSLIEFRRGSVFPEAVSDQALAGLAGKDRVADAVKVATWMHNFFMRQV